MPSEEAMEAYVGKLSTDETVTMGRLCIENMNSEQLNDLFESLSSEDLTDVRDVLDNI